MRIYQEMKGRRHIILLLLYLFTVHVGIHAQPNVNYVKTVRMLDSLQSHGITSYQFYNGRGWPFLSATDGLGMSGNYAYTLQSYDAAGNVSRQWLPVTGTSSIQLPTTSLNTATTAATAVSATTHSEGRRNPPCQGWHGMQEARRRWFPTSPTRLPTTPPIPMAC